ncbi:MAG: hypothetical protein ACKO83_07940 [Roseiflexaceae bacterium]
MSKHALVPVFVAIACIWGVLTLLGTPAPRHNVVSANDPGYPYPSATVELELTNTPEPIATTALSPTDTETPENTPTLTAELGADDQAAPTPNIAESPPEAAPDAEPQFAAPTEDTNEIMQCQPYQTYLLTGVTTPYTQLLLKFAERVVGGSMSDGAGRFAVPLNMGREAAGTHIITLVIRDSDTVIATLPCTVP